MKTPEEFEQDLKEYGLLMYKRGIYETNLKMKKHYNRLAFELEKELISCYEQMEKSNENT